MSTCRDRLKKLVKVQELKALHETRHATFLAAAASAETEAEELVGHFVRERFDRERLDIIAQRRGHE